MTFVVNAPSKAFRVGAGPSFMPVVTPGDKTLGVIEDPSTPAPVFTAATTSTTASFTPSANSLLVAICSLGASSGTITGTVTDSLSGTWTLRGRQNGSGSGSVEIWVRDIGSSPAAMTVTLTGSAGNSTQLSVRVLNGAAPAVQQQQVGAVAVKSTSPADVPITNVAAGSLIYASMVWTSASLVLAPDIHTTPILSTQDVTNGQTNGSARWTGRTAGIGSNTVGWQNAVAAQSVAVEIIPALSSTPASLRGVSTGNTGATNATSFTIAQPTGLAVGDYCLLWVDVGATAQTVTATGFTAITPTSGNSQTAALLYRVITGTESWPLTVSYGSAVQATGIIYAAQGATGIDVIPTTSGQTNASSQVITTPGVTTTKANDLLVWFGACSSASGAAPNVITAPAGMTARATQSNSASTTTTNLGAQVADSVQIPVGASPTLNGSIPSPSRVTAGMLVAIAGGAIAGGATHVQDTTLVLINNVSGTISFPSNTTVGNVVCLFIDTNVDISTGGQPVPTGGGVGTWTMASIGTGSNVVIYYGTVTSSGSNTITITFPGGNYWGAGASEFAGANAANLVSSVNYSTNGQASTVTVGPLSPSTAGQVAFVGNGTTNGVVNPPYTAGAPWTMGTPLTTSGTVGNFGNTDWLIVPSTTTLNAVYSYSAASTPQGVAGIILGIGTGPPIDTGAVTLTGTAGLAVDSFVTEVATVVESATAGMTIGAIVTEVGAVAMAAVAGLTIGTVVTEVAAVSESATASLTVSGTVTEVAVVSESASASLTVASIVTEVATVTETATASLTIAATVKEAASVTEAATTSLAVSGVVTEVAVVTETATTTLIVSSVVTEVAIVTEVATATLTISSAVTEVAVVIETATTTLTVAGSVAGANSITETALASLTVAAVVTEVASITLTSGASLTVAATVKEVAVVSFTATTTLVVASGTIVAGIVSMSATTTLVVSSVLTRLGVVAMSATTTLVVSGVAIRLGAVSFNAVAALTVGGTAIESGIVTMVAAAALFLVGQAIVVGDVTLQATTTITVIGIIIPVDVPKFATLVDDFSAPLDPDVWLIFPDGAAAAIDGQLHIMLPGDYGTSAYTVGEYDLTESHVAIELVSLGTPPLDANQSVSFIVAYNDFASAFLLNVYEGDYTVQQDWNILYTAPYDPAIQRWLRMRHTAGELHFEHSPDGLTWTDDLAVPLDPAPAMVLSLTCAYYNGSITDPNDVIFDNLNVPPAIAVPIEHILLTVQELYATTVNIQAWVEEETTIDKLNRSGVGTIGEA